MPPCPAAEHLFGISRCRRRFRFTPLILGCAVRAVERVLANTGTSLQRWTTPAIPSSTSRAARCSLRAAVQTARAASMFIAAMPWPTTTSGQTECVNAVTTPAAMMATSASPSLRADRNAALVKLPLWARKRASVKAQNRFTASAPAPVRVSWSAAGRAGASNFRQSIQRKASAGISRTPANPMPTFARRVALHPRAEKIRKIDCGILKEIDAVGKQGNRLNRQGDHELHAEISEVQKRHEPHGPSQLIVQGHRLRHGGSSTKRRMAWPSRPWLNYPGPASAVRTGRKPRQGSAGPPGSAASRSGDHPG